MSFGLQVYNPQGQVNVDSLALPNSLIDVFVIPTFSSTYTVSYPNYPGATIYVVPSNMTEQSYSGMVNVQSISYATGYPVVTFSNPYSKSSLGQSTGNSYIFVFLKKA